MFCRQITKLPFLSANFFTLLYSWNTRRRIRCCGVTESSLISYIYPWSLLTWTGILRSWGSRPFLSLKCRSYTLQEKFIGTALYQSHQLQLTLEFWSWTTFPGGLALSFITPLKKFHHQLQPLKSACVKLNYILFLKVLKSFSLSSLSNSFAILGWIVLFYMTIPPLFQGHPGFLSICSFTVNQRSTC